MASTSSLPKIIYGTAWKKEKTKELVVAAVLQGFRAIDTACQPKHYREDLVGEGLQELYDKHSFKREDIWLQTKYTSLDGQDTSKPLPYDASLSPPSQLAASVRTSLSNLRTTYLDSVVLHSPLRTLSDTLACWKALGELQDSGVVRMVGVSNVYDVGVLEKMEEVRPVQVVQDRWYEGNQWDKEVVKHCKRKGIMYQSFWTLTGSPNVVRHPEVIGLSKELGCTPAQLVYRIAQVNGVVPLAGSKNEEHMEHGVTAEGISLDALDSNPALEAVRALLFD